MSRNSKACGSCVVPVGDLPSDGVTTSYTYAPTSNRKSVKRAHDRMISYQLRLYEPMMALCIIPFVGLLARHHSRSWVDGKVPRKTLRRAKPIPRPRGSGLTLGILPSGPRVQ